MVTSIVLALFVAPSCKISSRLPVVYKKKKKGSCLGLNGQFLDCPKFQFFLFFVRSILFLPSCFWRKIRKIYSVHLSITSLSFLFSLFLRGYDLQELVQRSSLFLEPYIYTHISCSFQFILQFFFSPLHLMST